MASNTIAKYSRGKLIKLIEAHSTGSISGDTAITGTLDVTGATALNGTLNVDGAAIFESNMQIDGDVHIGGSLTGGSPLQVGCSINITGSADISGSLRMAELAAEPDVVEDNIVIFARTGSLFFRNDQGHSAFLGEPAGTDTQIQFNDGGSFQGDSGLTYNKTTDALSATRITASQGVAASTLSSSGDLYVQNDVYIQGTLYGGSPLNIGADIELQGSINLDQSISTVNLTASAGVCVTGSLRLNGSMEVVNGYVGIGVSEEEITHGLTLPNSSGADGQAKANAFVTYSSLRYKKDIKAIEDPLEKISRLRGVTYNWKDSGEPDVGLIAEEVGGVLPEVVSFETNGVDAFGIDYSKLTSLLLESIKAQQEMIENQNDKIQALEEKLEKILK